jgi:hypothetical protein
MSSLNLFPLNDFVAKLTLKDVDATGKAIPLTTGTVTAFLATSNGPTATAADPSLTQSATNLGGGAWLVSFDAAVLDPTLLASLFAGGVYLIVQKLNGVRAWFPVTYSADRQGTVS